MTSDDPFLSGPRREHPSPGPQQPAVPGYPAPPVAGYAPYQGYASSGSTPSSAPQPASGGTDGLSIAALVTGLLGLGPVAIVLGAFGVRATAGGRRGGAPMAWIGLALGVVSTVVWTAVITALVAAAPAVVEGWQEVGAELAGPQNYGDDPDLDAMWDACADGDMGACDDLYYESPFGSDYESFGDSCGERGRRADLDCSAS